MAGKKFVGLIVALALGTGAWYASPVKAQTWAGAKIAAIHPGSRMLTNGGQCTANFVFTNGSDVLLGQAAHCSSNSLATSTNGCQQEQPPLPLGTPVQIDGASRPGTLVYSSWNTMIASGEKDAATCAFNDFALVRLDPADVSKVNPSVPGWGGPRGTGKSAPNKAVFSFGNSDLRQGLRPLSPKTGITLFDEPTGWRYDTLMLTPGIPGDSGSGVLNSGGAALGILVTVSYIPPGLNGITSLAHAMGYARAHGMPGLNLVDGTQQFEKNSLNRLLRGMVQLG